MQIKTGELTGAALDWAVTTIVCPDALRYGVQDWREQRRGAVKYGEFLYRWHQSWAQSGPIIEREQIDVFCRPTGSKYSEEPDWASAKYLSPAETAAFLQSGATPLIAAMRCYVASKLGDEIDVPDELV